MIPELTYERTENNVLVNTNTRSLKQARRIKAIAERNREMAEKVPLIEKKINTIESRLNKILELLEKK